MAFYRKSEAKPSPVIPPPLKPEQQALCRDIFKTLCSDEGYERPLTRG